MNILLVITGLGRGGAERQVCDLADRFAQAGHHVWIIYLFGEALMRPQNSTIMPIGLHLRQNPISLVRTLVALRHHIRRINPDVIHSHMVHANLLVRFLRLFTPMPRLICTAHSTNEGGGLRMLLYRLTHHLADLSTNVSQKAVDAFVAKGAVPKGGMRRLYNGIDTARFTCKYAARSETRAALGVDTLTSMLLCVGRLEVQKNYPLMLHALALALQQQTNLHLYIAGEGSLHASLHQLCQSLHIEEHVTFLGFRQDIEALMCAADLFCLSSDFEGFGLVVAEAMACGLMVVATDCGGVKEVLGGNGFLTTVGDSGGFAQRIVEALALSTDAKTELIEAAKARANEYFSLEQISQEWIKLYANPKHAKMPPSFHPEDLN